MTHPVDEDVPWQGGVGFLQAAEAVHHPGAVKGQHDLCQAPPCRTERSVRRFCWGSAQQILNSEPFEIKVSESLVLEVKHFTLTLFPLQTRTLRLPEVRTPQKHRPSQTALGWTLIRQEQNCVKVFVASLGSDQ